MPTSVSWSRRRRRRNTAGYPATCHGGLTAAIVDETFGGLYSSLLTSGKLGVTIPGLTARLEMDYKRVGGATAEGGARGGGRTPGGAGPAGKGRAPQGEQGVAMVVVLRGTLDDTASPCPHKSFLASPLCPPCHPLA